MRFAKDVMTLNPKWISSEEKLVNTIDLFFKNGIHFAPVVTPAMQVLGLLSEVALVKATLRHYLDAGKDETVGNHRDLLDPAPFVAEDTPIQEVMKSIMQSPAKRVLVRSGFHNLVGIISPKDILRKVHGEHINSTRMASNIKDLNVHKDVKNLEELVHVYRELFESSPLLMFSADENGKIVMSNRKLSKELGYEGESLIGKNVQDLFPQVMQSDFDRLWNQTKEQGYGRLTISRMVRKDGSTVFVDIVSSALKSPEGKFVSTIIAARTIEDSKDLLTSLLSTQPA